MGSASPLHAWVLCLNAAKSLATNVFLPPRKTSWLKSLFLFSLFLGVLIFKNVILTIASVWFRVGPGCHLHAELSVVQIVFGSHCGRVLVELVLSLPYWLLLCPNLDFHSGSRSLGAELLELFLKQNQVPHAPQ